MKKTNKFSPEVRERAVRIVKEHRRENLSRWAAIDSIAPKIGCVPQTLNEWVIYNQSRRRCLGQRENPLHAHKRSVHE